MKATDSVFWMTKGLNEHGIRLTQFLFEQSKHAVNLGKLKFYFLLQVTNRFHDFHQHISSAIYKFSFQDREKI